MCHLNSNIDMMMMMYFQISKSINKYCRHSIKLVTMVPNLVLSYYFDLIILILAFQSWNCHFFQFTINYLSFSFYCVHFFIFQVINCQIYLFLSILFHFLCKIFFFSMRKPTFYIVSAVSLFKMSTHFDVFFMFIFSVYH